jgi:hypothetical protein
VDGQGHLAQHAVILVDPDRFNETYSQIAATVRSARPQQATPLYTALTDDPGLPDSAGLPGVLAVSTVDDVELGLLHGIDRVILLRLGLLDEWTVGGVVDGQEYPAAAGEPTGVAAAPAICAAVNLSLTPPDDLDRTRPGDAINHATQALSDFSVPVVAVGNHRWFDQGDVMSPWSEPDWVLSVGATVDAAGEIEWARSARGSATRPGVGPDVLTWGRRLSDGGWNADPADPADTSDPAGPADTSDAPDPAGGPEGFGTGCAAARITVLVALTSAWLLQVAANIDRLAGRPYGVPLVGVAVVDRRFAAQPPGPPALALPALPVLATGRAAFDALPERTAQQLAHYLTDVGGPHAARAVLLAAAETTSPQSVVDLSAPSLTLPRLTAFLDGLTIGDLLGHLFAADGDVPPARDGGEPLFPPGTADRLMALVEATMPVWEWEIDHRAARMRHPAR